MAKHFGFIYMSIIWLSYFKKILNISYKFNELSQRFFTFGIAWNSFGIRLSPRIVNVQDALRNQSTAWPVLVEQYDLMHYRSFFCAILEQFSVIFYLQSIQKRCVLIYYFFFFEIPSHDNCICFAGFLYRSKVFPPMNRILFILRCYLKYFSLSNSKTVNNSYNAIILQIIDYKITRKHMANFDTFIMNSK